MSCFRSAGIASAILALSVGFAAAGPVNGTGNVTPDIIFGSGNANGAFTGGTSNNIEVGLRGKQRFPAANIFNYDGDKTYTFDSTVLTTNPTNRSVFNFEWSINVDQAGTSGDMLGDFDYGLSFDTDPTGAIAMITIDPFATPGYFDHALGSNATPNGGGIESTSNADLVNNMPLFSVAQQSSNLGFGFSADPDLPGTYDFELSVFAKGTSDVLSSSAITVVVEPVPAVPLPASLPLFAAGIGALAWAARRRRKAA